ncbi:SDR family oxidoreductase [Fusibacter ferrireducens]|uniref:SDR family oxidoreductase n=1 Tax=Fusibacter ferrireducens TaxID=2785058 RepID=A0ABR9ZPW1_9FIRM|nr:SDR family oxidoreductase [Fusibacter ferrireducens]MBF4692510.1 SDR family oxidoreductase [Fusibacter ferrireducens]
MKMLVTGATGKLGTKVVQHLLKTVAPNDLAVSVRNPEKAKHLEARGIEVRQGDFDKPETLETAFSGVDRLLIISADGDNETRIRQHTNAVKAAQNAGVKFIAYTSLGNASESTLFLAPVHQATEAAILKTGIPYAFLRNNWYLENEIGSIQGVLAGAPWVTSAGSGKVGWALQNDYAEAAAKVLSGTGHECMTYELSGKLRTQEELVAALEVVLGRSVQVQQVDDATYGNIMKAAGIPDFVVPMLIDIQSDIRKGALEIQNSDFEKVLGHPVTPIEDALAQIVSAVSNG